MKIGLRTPLSELTVVNRDQSLLDEMAELTSYIADELNVQNVKYDAEESAYIELVAKPNFPVLGKRLGKEMKRFQKAIMTLDADAISALQAHGEIEIEGERFTNEEIEVLQQAREGTGTVSNSRIAVDLDCDLTPELIRGGYSREIVHRIQRARKEDGFDVADRIRVVYAVEGELAQAASEHGQDICSEVLALDWHVGEVPVNGQSTDISGLSLRFSLQRVLRE